MKRLALMAGTMAIAVAGSLAMADSGGYGPGMGRGMGMGMGYGCGAASGASADAGCPYGGGMGPGYGRGNGTGPRSGAGRMALLTPEEQTQHREAMQALKSVEACTAYVTQFRQLLQERAKEKGVAAPRGPNEGMCERMNAHGRFG